MQKNQGLVVLVQKKSKPIFKTLFVVVLFNRIKKNIQRCGKLTYIILWRKFYSRLFTTVMHVFNHVFFIHKVSKDKSFSHSLNKFLLKLNKQDYGTANFHWFFFSANFELASIHKYGIDPFTFLANLPTPIAKIIICQLSYYAPPSRQRGGCISIVVLLWLLYALGVYTQQENWCEPIRIQ